MPYQPEDFDAMFERSDDPWQFKQRWYEARKRALTLACLPAPRYAQGYEPGCANGELSAALAGRCDRLLVSDVSARAVALARVRLAALTNVEVSQAWLPSQWPAGSFDLIVISELGYFLSAEALDELAAKTVQSMSSDATVLACHWRRPIAGCVMDGDEVHRRLATRLALPQLIEVLDDDFRLDVWSKNPNSVAQREGFDW